MNTVTPGRQHFKAEAIEGWSNGQAVLGDYWEGVPCSLENCSQFALGFQTKFDLSLERHRDGADWVRHKSGLHFTESKDVEGLTTFTFPAGQQCFRGRTGGHMEPTGKPGRLFQETVDGRRDFSRPQDFNESMNIEADKAERVIKRG